MNVTLRGAAQVLRFPEGERYLRHDRAEELTLEPGTVGEGEIVVDCSGCAVLPGFVDAHTHLPFAGWRAEEYGMKVTGVPYEEIARRGGGIRSSARSFAAASDEQVLAQSRDLAREMLEHGTTAFECKSGYGLSVEQEERALRLAGELGPAAITALLAHAVPDGFTADGWMDEIERISLPDHVTAVDIYVESIAFTNDHLARMGEFARSRGVGLRAHVEQFSCTRAVPVALEHGARSVDHLAKLHPDDVEPLAASECCAVLLPGAEFMGNEDTPPARALADAGAICVLATDANPGTSPIVSMPLIAGLAVRRYGWSVMEALLAMTLNPAYLLGLEPAGDFVVLDGPVEMLPYRLGHNPVAVVVRGGEVVHVRPDQAWRVAA